MIVLRNKGPFVLLIEKSALKLTLLVMGGIALFLLLGIAGLLMISQRYLP